MMDWAKEAWDDLNRVVIDPDPASQSGDSIRVIGRSPTNDCIYTVIAVYVDGELVIATAWKSNSTQVQIYNNNLHLDGKQ